MGWIVDLVANARNLCVTLEQAAGLQPEHTSLVRVPLLSGRNCFHSIHLLAAVRLVPRVAGPLRPVPDDRVASHLAPVGPDNLSLFQPTPCVAGRQTTPVVPHRSARRPQCPNQGHLRDPRYRFVGMAGRPYHAGLRGWSRSSHSKAQSFPTPQNGIEHCCGTRICRHQDKVNDLNSPLHLILPVLKWV